MRTALAVAASVAAAIALAVGADHVGGAGQPASQADYASREPAARRTVDPATLTNGQDPAQAGTPVRVLAELRRDELTFTLVGYSSEDGRVCLGWSSAAIPLPSNCLDPAFERGERDLVVFGSSVPAVSDATGPVRLVWGYGAPAVDRVTIRTADGETSEGLVFATEQEAFRGRTVFVGEASYGSGSLTVEAFDSRGRSVASKTQRDPTSG